VLTLSSVSTILELGRLLPVLRAQLKAEMLQSKSEVEEKKLKEAAKDKQEAEEMLDIEKSMPINITASSSHNGHEHDMTEEDKQAVQSILSLSEETYEEVI